MYLCEAIMNCYACMIYIKICSFHVRSFTRTCLNLFNEIANLFQCVPVYHLITFQPLVSLPDSIGHRRFPPKQSCLESIFSKLRLLGIKLVINFLHVLMGFIQTTQQVAHTCIFFDILYCDFIEVQSDFKVIQQVDCSAQN